MTEVESFYEKWLQELTLRQRIDYEFSWRWWNWVVFPGLTVLSHWWYRVGDHFGWIDEIKSDY